MFKTLGSFSQSSLLLSLGQLNSTHHSGCDKRLKALQTPESSQISESLHIVPPTGHALPPLHHSSFKSPTPERPLEG